MGQSSKFDSALSTRGGRSNFVTTTDIFSGDELAKEILREMKEAGIKFSKEKIVFAARLENGNKIFLEKDGVEHIVERHREQFEKTFCVSSKEEITNVLAETISKGRLIKSIRRDSNGKEGYRSTYYYKGNYTVVYSIASNGYIETAFPIRCIGGKK